MHSCDMCHSNQAMTSNDTQQNIASGSCLAVHAVLCYKCEQRGHISRDCPNVGQFATGSSSKAAKMCIRCGRSKCAAAGLPDYHR